MPIFADREALSSVRSEINATIDQVDAYRVWTEAELIAETETISTAVDVIEVDVGGEIVFYRRTPGPINTTGISAATPPHLLQTKRPRKLCIRRISAAHGLTIWQHMGDA